MVVVPLVKLARPRATVVFSREMVESPMEVVVTPLKMEDLPTDTVVFPLAMEVLPTARAVLPSVMLVLPMEAEAAALSPLPLSHTEPGSWLLAASTRGACSPRGRRLGCGLSMQDQKSQSVVAVVLNRSQHSVLREGGWMCVIGSLFG